MSRADFAQEVPEPEPSCVRVGAYEIRCSVRGAEGRPLLLVNGLGAPLETWEPFRAALGTHRTIAFDAPGTGGSGTPMRPLAIREVAGIALELVEELGYSFVDVLGYSFGGAVAQEIARMAPSRVRSLVLAATNCGWGSPMGDLQAVTSAASAGASLSPRPNPLGYCWQLVSISMWSSFTWLDELEQPTLVLVGEEDRVVPLSAARLLVDELPNAQVAVVAGGEHWFLMTGAGARVAAERVLAFLGDQMSDVVAAEGPDCT